MKREFSCGAILFTKNKEGKREYVLIMEANGSYGFPKNINNIFNKDSDKNVNNSINDIEINSDKDSLMNILSGLMQ